MTIDEVYNQAIDDYTKMITHICSHHTMGIDNKNNNEILYAHKDGTWHSLIDDISELLKKGV